MRKGVTLPIAVFSDPDISYRELRVLAALCFYDPRKSGVCTVKRNLIAQLARVSETFVSRATRRLIQLGWVEERIGNGGRQRPNTYQINWHYLPALNGVQSGHGLEGINGVQSGQIEPLNGVQKTHPLEDKRCPENTPFKGQTVSNLDTPYQIKTTNTNNNTNLIRSEGQKSSAEFGFENVVNILTQHAVPLAFCTTPKDRKLITSWLSNGVTAARITAACKRALFSKTDGGSFGPAYIDKVLNTIAKEENNKREANSDLSAQSYATTSL